MQEQSTRTDQIFQQKRYFSPAKEKKQIYILTFQGKEGSGRNHKCRFFFLKKEQLEGKLMKVAKLPCGLFHKNQQSCGFPGARELEGKENIDHIT